MTPLHLEWAKGGRPVTVESVLYGDVRSATMDAFWWVYATGQSIFVVNPDGELYAIVDAP